ncbi:Late embryogenesis abundant protein B19.4, partial [Ophiophagus hannah]
MPCQAHPLSVPRSQYLPSIFMSKGGKHRSHRLGTWEQARSVALLKEGRKEKQMKEKGGRERERGMEGEQEGRKEMEEKGGRDIGREGRKALFSLAEIGHTHSGLAPLALQSQTQLCCSPQ